MKLLLLICSLGLLLSSIFFKNFLMMGYKKMSDFDEWKKEIIERNMLGIGFMWKFFDETLALRWILMYLSIFGILVSFLMEA